MSFDDFKGIWFVRKAQSGETEGHMIAIGGRPGKVTVVCVDDRKGHEFPTGRYLERPERIEFDGKANAPFTLTVETGEVNVVSCTPGIGHHQGPGSWTADDNSGDDGN